MGVRVDVTGQVMIHLLALDSRSPIAFNVHTESTLQLVLNTFRDLF